MINSNLQEVPRQLLKSIAESWEKENVVLEGLERLLKKAKGVRLKTGLLSAVEV